ncbi:unnamed protein product [Polarella glacialis]|uniref:Uncharacterized protein n=1 Tax=Polarella glacialis TaxID=89957 RepID=A0A813HGX7_POLGL|nr:unnamed protein product [Polarella glacialis]
MVCQDLIDQQGVRCFVHTIDMSSTLRTGVRKQTAGCQTLWSGNCGGRRFPNSRRDRVNCGLPATSSTDKNSNKDNNNCDSNGGLPATSSTAHQYDIWEGLFDGIIEEESHAFCLLAEHFRYFFTFLPILDAQIVKAALDHISIEDLRIIDLHAKASSVLPPAVNATIYQTVARFFDGRAKLSLAGSHAEDVAVRLCSDFDFWIHTPEFNVSKTKRSALHTELVQALQTAGCSVKASRIGRKAIKFNLQGHGEQLHVDVVCVDMDCDCGFNNNTIPKFTQTSDRKRALQQASEYVKGSATSRIAIRAMKVFCYHAGPVKGAKSVPGFILNHLARRIELQHQQQQLEHQEKGGDQPILEVMDEVQLFKKMAFEIVNWRHCSIDSSPLNDLRDDAIQGKFRGRLDNLLKRPPITRSSTVV